MIRGILRPGSMNAFSLTILSGHLLHLFRMVAQLWCKFLYLIFIINRLSLASAQASIASSLSSECVSFISQYPPTVSLYASQICHVCQGLGVTPSVEACCGAVNPTACFASSFYSISATDTAVTETLGLSQTGFPETNCDSVTSILKSCQAATPNILALCFHDQQSCLCSTSSTFAGDYYDNFWSGCLSWAETYNPSMYSELGPSANGVVQSRPCQIWSQLTATGGTPSNCATSASATLTSTSLAPLSTATAQGAAADQREQVGSLLELCDSSR